MKNLGTTGTVTGSKYMLKQIPAVKNTYYWIAACFKTLTK